jgi:hypothetical protein
MYDFSLPHSFNKAVGLTALRTTYSRGIDVVDSHNHEAGASETAIRLRSAGIHADLKAARVYTKYAVDFMNKSTIEALQRTKHEIWRDS